MRGLAPFLSLRRGERWRREAATEWGKAFARRVIVARQAQSGEQENLRHAAKVDPHSVELRSTPLPRSTGERKGPGNERRSIAAHD
ncbi:hypothetical protein MPL3356_200077 [Mesorhizobium plurifarium]|uniref:Uncharacterized protein n=1 Tax=Mesorhizobium plurifarium TaxID=69974 RepID=A0A090DJB4_MESPL|nr:hypothetical protein MPL3356_200077 [Mesorhizobium plurifarium]CDX44603.1 hypothetical protein MPLDJ20_60663 [Mesorhizobium plurifarium]